MEGKPLYRTMTTLGLAMHAVSSLIHAALTPASADKVFFLILAAVATVGAVATAKWVGPGQWVGLVASVALAFITWWMIFPTVQGFAISVLDFFPAVLGFLGGWTALISSILWVIRRKREPREFTAGTKGKLMKVGAAVLLLTVVSGVLTVTGKDKVAATDRAGATVILMENGDEFTPAKSSVTGSPVRLVLENKDPFAHTFTIEDGYDINQVFGPGDAKVISFTPKGPGTIKYKCDFHQEMKGELVVA